MKYLLSSIAVLVLALPAAARAENRITDTQVELLDDVVEIHLRADEAIESPRVRSTDGVIRFWFPGMQPSHIDRDGDGRALRFVRVRPGMENTSVVVVRLRDSRQVPDNAIEVDTDGQEATIRIDRRNLPGGRVRADRNEAAAADEIDGDGDVDADDDELDAESVEPEPLAFARTADAGPLSAGSSQTPLLFVLLILGLGGMYLLLRLAQKRLGPTAPKPRIEVVANQRLGARHQIVVVRALGEDHLLSVQPGRTEKLASIPAPPPEEAPEDSGDQVPPLRLAASRGAAVERRPRFGAELMRLADSRADNDRVELTRTAGGSTSEAVSGLLRLRERVGR